MDGEGRAGRALLMELVAEVPDNFWRRNSKPKLSLRGWLWLSSRGHRACSGAGMQVPGRAFPCPVLPAQEDTERGTAKNFPGIALLSILSHRENKSSSLCSVASWKVKLCSSVVRNKKSSMRASASPGHIRFPGHGERDDTDGELRDRRVGSKPMVRVALWCHWSVLALLGMELAGWGSTDLLRMP